MKFAGCVRDIIRADTLRRAERELTGLLHAGQASGPAHPAGKAYWARKRKALGRCRPT